MKDLRPEIRSAFEKEQAENPPRPDLRQSVAAAVAREPRRHVGLQWIAVVAAVLLGLLVVAGLMSTRLLNRSSVPVAPKASPVADYGPPPPGMPLIYVDDPVSHPWLIGFDWSGHPRATVKLTKAVAAAGTIAQAPDGSSFVLSPGGKGAHPQYLDRLGNALPVPSPEQLTHSAKWADDSRQVCVLASLPYGTLPSPWQIGVMSLGTGAISYHPVGIDSPNLHSGIIAVEISSCSPRNDRAILTYVWPERPTEVWVVRLSDGALLVHHLYPAGQLAGLLASPDGAYIAESSAASASDPTTLAAPATVIRRVADWQVVLPLPAYTQVLGFSGDGTHVLISKQPVTTGLPAHLEIVDWTVPHGVWNYDGPLVLDRLLFEPASGGFALALVDAGRPQSPVNTILIVHGDGSSAPIPGRYDVPW